jgi:hypothetical protein
MLQEASCQHTLRMRVACKVVTTAAELQRRSRDQLRRVAESKAVSIHYA